jgi:hypothetical protein
MRSLRTERRSRSDQLPFFHPRIREAVEMPAVLVGGVLVQEGLHGVRGLVGEFEAEVLVGAANGTDLVLDEVLEVQIHHLAIGQPARSPVRHRVVVGPGQRHRVVLRDLRQGYPITREPAQRGHQAADRNQHAHGVPMGLHEQRVRVLAVDVLDVPEVLG